MTLYQAPPPYLLWLVEIDGGKSKTKVFRWASSPEEATLLACYPPRLSFGSVSVQRTSRE